MAQVGVTYIFNPYFILRLVTASLPLGLFEAINNNQTKLTTIIELTSVDKSMDKTFLISELNKAGRLRKELIESET
jgi:hypothetical protein